MHAEEVRIRESFGSGAVIKVEIFDEQNAAHSVWAGNDTTTDLNYLMIKFPKTAFKADRIKYALATNVVARLDESMPCNWSAPSSKSRPGASLRKMSRRHRVLSPRYFYCLGRELADPTAHSPRLTLTGL